MESFPSKSERLPFLDVDRRILLYLPDDQPLILKLKHGRRKESKKGEIACPVARNQQQTMITSMNGSAIVTSTVLMLFFFSTPPNEITCNSNAQGIATRLVLKVKYYTSVSKVHGQLDKA